MNQYQLYIDPDQLAKEVKFTMSTSSGNGGQNVNRVATKATLHFSVSESTLFTEIEKQIILEKLANKITNEGFLVISSQESRSAQKNKLMALKRLLNILQGALTPQKKRKKKGIPRAVKEKRLSDKKRNAEKKELRKKFLF